MACLLDHEMVSSSMSKIEENLSNEISEGPLLRRRDQDDRRTNNECNSSRRDWRNNVYKSKTYGSNEKKKQNVHCLWSFVIIIAIIGICNLLLTLTVIIVLRVTQGMESLEVIPEEDLVKFYGSTDLDNVCLKNGVCEGFGDVPVELIGDTAAVQMDVRSHTRDRRSRFEVDPGGISITKVTSFKVTDSQNEPFFTTDSPNIGLPDGVGNLEVKIAQTHRIVAPMNQSLRVESNITSVHGAEGATLEAQEIVWTANNNISMDSKNNVVLEAKNGILLDINNIPITHHRLPNQEGMKPQYKICICLPQGKLFKVPVENATSIVNASFSYFTIFRSFAS